MTMPETDVFYSVNIIEFRRNIIEVSPIILSPDFIDNFSCAPGFNIIGS